MTRQRSPFATALLPILAGWLILSAPDAPARESAAKESAGQSESKQSGAPESAPGLIGPERFRFENRPSDLHLADLNNDGRMDFVAYDNQRSLLTILYSKEDAKGQTKELRFENDGDWTYRPTELVLSLSVQSIGIGDLNGDGRDDLAMTGSQNRAIIHYQGDAGLDETAVKLDEKAKRLLVADFNDDDRDDLLLIGEEGFVVMLQNENGDLAVERKLSGTVEPAHDPILTDLDGDGRQDLAFASSAKRQTLIVRLGEPDGAFGPEMPFEIDDHFDFVALNDGRLAFIEPKTRAIRVIELSNLTKEKIASRADLASPQLIPLPSEITAGAKDIIVTTLPDESGDNRMTGALVSLAEGADLFTLSRQANGHPGLRPIPSLAGIKSLALLPDGDADRAILLSENERLAAALNLKDNATLQRFPAPLKMANTPLAIAVGSYAGEPALWSAYFPDDDEDEEMAIGIFSIGEDGSAIEKATFTLEETEEFEPDSLIVGDFNNDDATDFLIFFKFEDSRLYLASPSVADGDAPKADAPETDEESEDSEAEAFVLLEGDAGLKRGLLEDLSPRDILLGDVDGDGENEIVMTREKFLRSYFMNADNELAIEEQMNPPDRAAKLAAPGLADIDADGMVDIVCIDTEGKRLLVFQADENGDHGDALLADVPEMKPSKLVTGDFTGDGRDDVLILGGKSLALLRGGEDSHRIRTLHTRLTDIEDGFYGQLFAAAPATLEVEGAAESSRDRNWLYAVEARENMLEFLSPGDGDALESVYRFRIFEQNRQLDDSQLRRLTTEPHNLKTADVDGDGRIDVVVLAHENLIVYRSVEPSNKDAADNNEADDK